MRLYHESVFQHELEPLGITKAGFRCLCRSLRVTLIHTTGGAYVDSLAFALGLRCAVQLGQPDFHFPGSMARKKGKLKEVHGQARLPRAAVLKHHQTAILELLSTHRTDRLRSLPQLRKAAFVAAESMLNAGLHALTVAERNKQTRHLVKSARARGFIDVLTHEPKSEHLPARGP